MCLIAGFISIYKVFEICAAIFEAKMIFLLSIQVNGSGRNVWTKNYFTLHLMKYLLISDR